LVREADRPTLTIKEVAALVGKTERSVRGHIKKGTFEIPHFRVGGSMRFWRFEVELWIEKTKTFKSAKKGKTK